MSAGTATEARRAVRVGRFGALRHRPVAVGLAALVALAVAIVAGVAFGNIAVPVGDTIGILAQHLGWPVATSWPASAETIVVDLRLPRVLTAAVVGAGATGSQ
jgi:iron complex transport system permease protein